MAIVASADAGERAITRGANLLQLRIPRALGAFQYSQARELVVLSTVPVLMSSRIDIALAVDAAGVNLPADDIPPREARRLLGDRILGRSVHSIEKARGAEADGVDYVLFGPVFDTPTHPGAIPAGLETLREVAASLSIPVIAIGGIDERRAEQCVRAGAAGIAGIRMFA